MNTVQKEEVRKLVHKLRSKICIQIYKGGQEREIEEIGKQFAEIGEQKIFDDLITQYIMKEVA